VKRRDTRKIEGVRWQINEKRCRIEEEDRRDTQRADITWYACDDEAAGQYSMSPQVWALLVAMRIVGLGQQNDRVRFDGKKGGSKLFSCR